METASSTPKTSSNHYPTINAVFELFAAAVHELAGRAAKMLTVGFIGGQHVGPEHAETLNAAGAQAIVTSHDELHSWL